MKGLGIQTHDFEESKNQLRKFSEKIPNRIKFEIVAEKEGWLGFDHKVTGAELNKLTSQIQKHFIDINNVQNTTIKEFKEVYNALESLDKDYIQAILLSINAAEKASKQALDSAIEARKNTVDIMHTIEIQESIISTLEQFHVRLCKYKHLENIDEIWNETKLTKENVAISNEQINQIREELVLANEQISQVRTLIAEERDNEITAYFNKKLKTAYILAVCSIGITLFTLIAHLIGKI